MKSFQYFGIAVVMAALASPLQASPFDLLFRVMTPKGTCQVRTPAMAEFEPAIRNKAYPYGTVIQTVGAGSSVVLMISESDAVRILADTTVELAKEPAPEKGKIVKLSSGTVLTRFSPTVTNTPVYVDTAIGRAQDMLGNCKLVLEDGLSDTTLALTAESNSQLKFVGPQFVIPCLRNRYGAKITTADDRSYTRIRNLLGDYQLFINTGLEKNPVIPTEDEGSSEFLLPIKTSTQSTVNIWRENAPIGNRLIVSVLATDSDGKGSQSFAFAVGDPSVSSRSHVQDIVAATNAPADAAVAEETQDEEDPLAAFTETTENAEGTEDAGTADETAVTEENALDEFLF